VHSISTQGAERAAEEASWLGLVFGREHEGLMQDELATCDATCSISMGRLQESLSLSHAVAVVLSECFQHRWHFLPRPVCEQFEMTAPDDDAVSTVG
jgi:tRNA C32,U32 (ribose-2'-O)-methylase TrmJ